MPPLEKGGGVGNATLIVLDYYNVNGLIYCKNIFCGRIFFGDVRFLPKFIQSAKISRLEGFSGSFQNIVVLELEGERMRYQRLINYARGREKIFVAVTPELTKLRFLSKHNGANYVNHDEGVLYLATEGSLEAIDLPFAMLPEGQLAQKAEQETGITKEDLGLDVQ